MADEAVHLRVLVADEDRDRRDVLVRAVEGLGHDAVGWELGVGDVGTLAVREQPDAALVGLESGSPDALELISGIVREAACPVIAVLSAEDPNSVNEAAIRGVFAYTVESDPKELQSVLSIVLRRFAEYHNLQWAFGRRATIEQAKGILMARHAIDQAEAFEMLRRHARHTGRRLVDVAEAVVGSHALLLSPQSDPPTRLAQPEQTSEA